MKARRAKAWACSFCNKIYYDDPAGKSQANRCCMCCECGSNMAEYIGGTTQKCRECHGKQVIADAEKSVAHAVEYLHKVQGKFQ